MNNARGLYLRWRELNEGSASPELSWTATELRNSLRSIEWDLEDLDDTIDILLKVHTASLSEFSSVNDLTTKLREEFAIGHEVKISA